MAQAGSSLNSIMQRDIMEESQNEDSAASATDTRAIIEEENEAELPKSSLGVYKSRDTNELWPLVYYVNPECSLESDGKTYKTGFRTVKEAIAAAVAEEYNGFKVFLIAKGTYTRESEGVEEGLPVVDLSELTNFAIVGGINSDVTEIGDDFDSNEAKTTIFDGGESSKNIVVVDSPGINGELRNLELKGGKSAESGDTMRIKFNSGAEVNQFSFRSVSASFNGQIGPSGALVMKDGSAKILEKAEEEKEEEVKHKKALWRRVIPFM